VGEEINKFCLFGPKKRKPLKILVRPPKKEGILFRDPFPPCQILNLLIKAHGKFWRIWKFKN